MIGSIAQLVRAFGLHPKGQRFEPSWIHQKIFWASGGTVYTRHLKCRAERLVGSNPTLPTMDGWWNGRHARLRA